MAAPTLLVGLGGTGSKIVLRVSKMVTEEQRQHIGFAVFDTDINELRQIREENPFIKTIQTSTKLTVGEYLNIDTHARDNWFPVNQILCSKALTEGAGQVRAISRLAFDTAIRAGNMEPLHSAIEDLYKLESSSDDQALRVIIVSSLAGGTGSGLILPVALYVKNFLATRFQQGANITRGFFILPEVFYEVIRGQAERNNLKCNAYAAIREIDAFLMKGDATLPDKYADTVKLEFPREGSDDFEQYNVRPYDFCFLFDAQNTEGKKLNDFNRYLDHAANCIYSQSIGPMNKRSNSSEDNTIRELCAQSGRNRYAGAGSSMLIYPFEDVKEYIALKWTQQCVSEQWLEYDRMFKEQQINNAEMRAQGFNVKDANPSTNYIDSVEQLDKQKQPFARAIVNSCSIFDQAGLAKVGDRWSEYVAELKKFITRDAASGQRDIDAQKQQTQQLIGEISGGREVWETFQDAYREMMKYRLMVEKRCEDTARTIAYSVFKTKNDSATKDKLKHQLETYLRDTEDNFIHPNAVRYFLYKTYELLKLEKQKIDKKIRDAESHFQNFEQVFDDPETDETETIDDLASRKHTILKYFSDKAQAEELKKKFSNYVTVVDEYRTNGILAAVLEEGISYVKNLCDSFQVFYTTFESQLGSIEKKTATLEKKYDHTKGTAARYVCASSACLERMLSRMPYTGSTVTIDGKLAEEIYNRVRNYSMLKEKPKGENYFGEIFEKGIIGYFKDTLMESYGMDVNLDILTALEKEAEYEHGEYEASKIDQYVRRAINDTRKLSNPFIERPLGEQKEPISACTFSKDLDPKDDSPRSNLIAKELKNYGGEPDSDIPKNMIMFYQSIYGLRANKLSKFAPADETGRCEGEYYKAYYELVNQIKPKSDKTPVITPHIDKNWHIISQMPDLDEGNQKAQETRIYKAFILGFVFDLIRFTRVSGKKCYKLYLKNCDPEGFVVSNQTECDNYYEVLDALTINPVIVKSIIDSVERRLSKERSGSGKISFDKSFLKSRIDLLECPEFEGIKDLSIFDLCALLKVSTPAADFDNKTGLDILKVVLGLIFDYIRGIVPDSEADLVFGKYVVEQYDRFMANFAWYRANHDESVFEFIDDIASAIADDLDDKDLDDFCEEINLKAKAAHKA